MARTTTDPAVTDSEETGPKGPRTIATYLPGGGTPGIVRKITKKDAKDGLLVDLEDDVVWDHTTNHRADVTGLPEGLIEYLKSDPKFRVREEGGS